MLAEIDEEERTRLQALELLQREAEVMAGSNAALLRETVEALAAGDGAAVRSKRLH